MVELGRRVEKASKFVVLGFTAALMAPTHPHAESTVLMKSNSFFGQINDVPQSLIYNGSIPSVHDFELQKLLPLAEPSDKYNSTLMLYLDENRHVELSTEQEQIFRNSNVQVLIENKDGELANCNGVHIGEGKIATVGHCINDPEKLDFNSISSLKVSAIDSNGVLHSGVFSSYFPELDAGILTLRDNDLPGASVLGNASILLPGAELIVYTSINNAVKGKTEYESNRGIFLGKDTHQKENSKFRNSNFYFNYYSAFSDHGDSGSGIYEPKTGKLIGLHTGTYPTTVVKRNAIRIEVFQRLLEDQQQLSRFR